MSHNHTNEWIGHYFMVISFWKGGWRKTPGTEKKIHNSFSDSILNSLSVVAFFFLLQILVS